MGCFCLSSAQKNFEQELIPLSVSLLLLKALARSRVLFLQSCSEHSRCCLELPLAQNFKANVQCFVSLLLKLHIYIQIPDLAFDVLSVSLPAQKNDLRSALSKSSKFSTSSLGSTLFKNAKPRYMFCLSHFWGYIYSNTESKNTCSVCLSARSKDNLSSLLSKSPESSKSSKSSLESTD